MNNTIKNLRTNKGFSQTYLASYLKISRQMYIKYENGEVDAPVKVIRDLCKLYSISYDVIIDDKLNDNDEPAAVYHFPDSPSYQFASPGVAYGPSKPENFQLNKLFMQIKKLPEKYLPSVSAFILLLQQEEKAAANEKKNSKQAFFDLAGKIELDSDEESGEYENEK